MSKTDEWPEWRAASLFPRHSKRRGRYSYTKLPTAAEYLVYNQNNSEICLSFCSLNISKKFTINFGPIFNINANQCVELFQLSHATRILNLNRHMPPPNSSSVITDQPEKIYPNQSKALTFLFVACWRVCNRVRESERLYPIPKFTISSCSLDNVTNPIWRTI